jgi:nucleotide-binding universal stress UspA family protein
VSESGTPDANEGGGDRGSSKIVVGVDGSETSLRALRWAARQAGWTGGTLEVVTAWTFPEQPAPLGIVAHVPWQEDLMAEARDELDRLVGEAVPEGERDHVHTKVVRGGAADVLLAEADEAELLVVGSRGRGAFEGLLLGSVSERCVHHARCPVVVVR